MTDPVDKKTKALMNEAFYLESGGSMLNSSVYILLHHPFSQDPRVTLLSKSLTENGIANVLVGIETMSVHRDEHESGNQWQNLPLFSALKVYQVYQPFFFFLKNARLSLLQKILWGLSVLAVAILLMGLLIFLSPLLFIAKVMNLKSKMKSSEKMKPLYLLLWRWLSPLIYAHQFLRYFLTYYNFLKDKNDIKVIHCNDLETLLIGVFYKKIYRLTLVYDAHEFFSFQTSLFSGLPQRILIFYEKILVRQADYLFTVSAMLAQKMEELFKISKKYIIVPNVFSAENIIGNRKSSLKQPTLFHYVGGFLDERGIDFLIDCWAHIEPGKAHLHLRGPQNDYRDMCEKKAQDLDVLNRSVFFEQPVSEDEIVETCSQFDVGIIPYRPVNLNNKYSCPNKINQYMSAGNAILTNDLPNVVGFIERYHHGCWYKDMDVNSFLSCVDRLINSEVLESYKQNSLEWCKAEYNWENYGVSFVNLYKGL